MAAARRGLIGFALLAMLISHAIAAEVAKPSAPRARIQMAILLDTSGSMDGLINQARTELWTIVNELATVKRDGQVPDLEVALYEYGKSSIPASAGHLRQIVPLTDDLDKLSQELFALKTKGGQEYCGQVIQAATKGLDWSKSDEDLKLIFIAGNEPFTQGSVDYKEACRTAINSGIIVNTIFCGPQGEGVKTGWQDGAKLADGSFLSIDQNREVAEIATPYDKKLTQLSSDINGTIVAFGRKTERANSEKLRAAADAAAESAAPAAAAERARFKASGRYRGAAQDLAQAVKNGKVKLQDLKEADLPEELKKLSVKEREKYLSDKLAERQKIEKEIRALAEKRKAFIAKARRQEASEGGDALGTAIIKAVREQAQRKKFTVSGKEKK